MSRRRAALRTLVVMVVLAGAGLALATIGVASAAAGVAQGGLGAGGGDLGGPLVVGLLGGELLISAFVVGLRTQATIREDD